MPETGEIAIGLRFDRIARLATRLFGVPTAAVTLVYRNMVWPIGPASFVRPVPLEQTFCEHVLKKRRPLVVPDAAEDPHFRDLPHVVGAPRVRFYAGAPLVLADGARVGAFCIADTKPHASLARVDRSVLADMASLIADEIDIRERYLHIEELQRALAASTQRYRDLIEGSAQGILIHRDFKPLFANAAYARIMGLPSVEAALSMESILPTIAEEIVPVAIERNRAIMAGETIADHALARPRLSGPNERWYEVFDRRISWDGGPALQVTLVDVTDRVQNERELVALAEQREAARVAAEEANSAKARFLARMTHELRTPLASIGAVLDLLAEPLSPEERARTAELGSRSVQALVDLLSEVLDFSAFESGERQPVFEPVAIGRVVREVVDAFVPSARAKGLKLDATIRIENSRAFRLDRRFVRQILTNLLSNAIRFTERGWVSVRLRLEGGRLMLTVADSGIGMGPSEITRAFEPFAQGSEAIGTRYGGTGLGLPLVRRMTAELNGRVDIASRKGDGTTVTVELPAQEAFPPGAEPAISAPESSTHAHVLIADDNAVNLLLFTEILRRAGFRVTPASNAKAAIAQVGTGDVDLLLLDLQMPEIDGWTCARTIRRSAGRQARVPIVAFTADAPATIREADTEGLFDGVIEKPLSLGSAVALIDSLVGRSGADRAVPLATLTERSGGG